MRTANSAVLALLLIFFARDTFAQSETHSPRSSATTPLTLQDLSLLKKRDANETFPVVTTNGNAVANLMNIVLDQQSGQPRFALLNLFENVAEKRPFTLVPWELLAVDKAAGEIIIQTSVEKLRNAPTVQPKQVQGKVQSTWGQNYYAHYGLRPDQGASTGSTMLPAGTITGSGTDGREQRPAVRGVRVYLLAGLGALALFTLLLALNRHRISDPK